MTDAPPPSRMLLASYLDDALMLAGIPVAPEWRDGILAHFEAIAAAARLVDAFALDDHVEAAPVFRA